jgi:hypothetical protein
MHPVATQVERHAGGEVLGIGPAADPVGGFQQSERHAAFGGVLGCRQTGRARTDDDDVDIVCHGQVSAIIVLWQPNAAPGRNQPGRGALDDGPGLGLTPLANTFGDPAFVVDDSSSWSV